MGVIAADAALARLQQRGGEILLRHGGGEGAVLLLEVGGHRAGRIPQKGILDAGDGGGGRGVIYNAGAADDAVMII